MQNTDSVVQDDRELKKEQPAMPEDTHQRQDGGDPVHGEPGEGAENPRYGRSPQAEPRRKQIEQKPAALRLSKHRAITIKP